MEINLTQGKVAIIDDIDAGLVDGKKWFAHLDSRSKAVFYARRHTSGKGGAKRGMEHLHRLIAEAMLGRPLRDGEVVDHINHDGLDNRRSNLRVVSQRLNVANKRKTNGTSSRYKGVCRHKATNKWQADIRSNGERHYIGSFKSEAEAAFAYDVQALLTWGIHAHTNFIKM